MCRRLFCVKRERWIQENEHFSAAQEKRWKNLSKSVDKEAGGVVLYLSAKRWGKRTTSKASAGSLWKEPIDAEKFQFVLRNFLSAQVQTVQKLLKNRAWQKTTSVVKYTGRQPQGWGATGPWKLNNIEKLVRNLLSVWKNTKNNSKSNSHRTQAIACWANKI